MSDDLARREVPVSAVDLLENHHIFRFLALNLDDGQNDSTGAHPTGILHSDLIFDFDVHLLDEADGDFGGLIGVKPNFILGQADGETLDTMDDVAQNFAIGLVEGDFPVA